jgi:hypothetical protein
MVPALIPARPAPARQGQHPHPGPSLPDVHITIGRIEVRAAPEARRETRREQRQPSAPSLHDYLRSRDGRG